MPNGAREPAGHPSSAPPAYRWLRGLGARSQPTFAALREPSDVVVAQRFVRAQRDAESTVVDAEAMALLLRDARCLAKSWHLNIARVRHVDLARGSELTIASELIDGATLADLVSAAAPERTSPRDPLLALPILVRILLDVLAGLNALHGLRDGMNAPLAAIHGELCPANVVVGKDGVARIVNVLRPRPAKVVERSEAVGYAAPEALDGKGTDDVRADVYAVGVMLWEGLAGRRLHDETDPARVLSRQREGDLVAPAIHPSSPFARLADTAMRAIAFDPALRFRGPAEMAAELRKIAGTRLASGAAIAARVVDLAGDRIRARRALFDPAVSGTRRRASEGKIAAARAEPRSTTSGSTTSGSTTSGSTTSGTLKASPRRAAPTLAADVPVALLMASRPSASDDRELIVDEALIDGDDDDELLGPRASSPEIALEAGGTEQLIARALATTTAQTREVAAARHAEPAPPPPPLAVAETPGDFVIPIDVVEAIDETPPRRRLRSLAVVGLIAATMLIVMAAFVATRRGLSFPATQAPIMGAPAPPPPVPAPTRSDDPVREATSSSTSAATSAPTTATATATPTATPTMTTTGRPTTRAPAPPPPAAPTAKPKKSVYDPDGL